MNIYIVLKLLHTLEGLRNHEHWTRGKLETNQSAALHRLRQYAYDRSPFYQRFHKGLSMRPLGELPVLTKAMMMEHFDELVTDRSLHLDEVRAFAAQRGASQRYKNRYWVNATSGSSGIRDSFCSMLGNGRMYWLLLHAARSGQVCGSVSHVNKGWQPWLR